MSTYTEVGISFKTFLKENYAIAFDSYYLFTKNVKHEIEHDIVIVLIWRH